MKIAMITVVLLLIFFILFCMYVAILHVIEKQFAYTKCWNQYIAKQANDTLRKKKCKKIV